ncbi:hypothetical protein VITU9109_14748 [Vibrio tubiashii ATCC 19109]|uniref:Transposase n=1 Tax=Vibrio tubiashii ATCC 19109 TaxID=1051646 RepID=A0ABN0DKX5_9VIBR|nr:hypothetical protein VITU9109_14748 [Vibrio tubiashii ATCC 19109]
MYIGQINNQNKVDEIYLPENAIEETNCPVRETDLAAEKFQHP